MKEESRFAVHDLTKKYLLSQLSELGIVLYGTLNTLNSVIGKAFKNFIFNTYGGKAEVLTLTAPAELNLPIGTTVTYYNQRYEKDFINFLKTWIKTDAHKYLQGNLDKLNLNVQLSAFTIAEMEKLAEKKLVRIMRDNFGKENRIECFGNLLTPQFVQYKLDFLKRIMAKYHPNHEQLFSIAITEATKRQSLGLTTKFQYPCAALILDHCSGKIADYFFNRGGEKSGIVEKSLKRKIEEFKFNSIGMIKLHYDSKTKKLKTNDGANREYLIDFEYFIGNLSEIQLADTISTEIEIYNYERFIEDHAAQNDRTAQTNSVKVKNPDFTIGRRVQEIRDALPKNENTQCAFANAAKQKAVARIMEYYQDCGGKNLEEYKYMAFFPLKEKLENRLTSAWTTKGEYPQYLIKDVAGAIKFYEKTMEFVTKKVSVVQLRDNIRASVGLLELIVIDQLSNESFRVLPKPETIAKCINNNISEIRSLAKSIAQKDQKLNTKELMVNILIEKLGGTVK